MKTEIWLEYPITREKLLKELIEERFFYIRKRTKLSRLDFQLTRFLINKKTVSGNTKVFPGDKLFYLHKLEDEAKLKRNISIVYEDDHLLVIEKHPGFAVVPRASHHFNSIVFLLNEKFPNKDFTPLHRLDIETSGLLMIAKRKNEIATWHKLFREKIIKKTYRTLVYGKMPNIEKIEGKIVKDENSSIYSKYKLNPVEEKNSETKILSIEHFSNFSELILQPITGKTNQLRIHLSAIGHSIIGDKKYYKSEDIYHHWLKTGEHSLEKMKTHFHALHAESIKFFHPFFK
jgi:RluA family pseudouridine synthase